MAQLSVSDIEDSPDFRLLVKIPHHDIGPFVYRYYLERQSWVLWAHYLLSLGILAAWIYASRQYLQAFEQWIAPLGLAALAFFPLIPVHEAIHGAAYRLVGARDVRYSVSIRKMYAYAIAHHFIASPLELFWVAIAPFLIINAGILVMVLAFEPLRVFGLALLLIHTAGTSGDWAMLNYLWLHRDREIYTYDDADAMLSYFYERTGEPSQARPATEQSAESNSKSP